MSRKNRRRSIDIAEMGTFSSELQPFAAQLFDAPRVYADANIPNGVVDYMRTKLAWDVFFVLEHHDLRRASDKQHYQLARQLGRTLVTLDHDYTNDRRFPPDESPGVIVFSAPDERWLRKLLKEADDVVFRANRDVALPLARRKILWEIGQHG
jgi:predicted nuclease of predicted toxin-antitoxin system